MRVIYPEISANEYLSMVKQDETLPEQRRKILYRDISISAAVYFISFITILTVLIFFARELPFGIICLLGTVIALVPSCVIFLGLYIRLRGSEEFCREPLGFDKGLMSYYRLCDTFRTNGIKDISMHLVGDRCDLDVTYKDFQEEKKATFYMNWHLSNAINDVVIDFDRRDVTVPKNMCEAIEEK